MAETVLRNRAGAAIDPGIVDEFAAGLAGRALRPSDADYDAARQIWNAAIDRHPGLIVALPWRGRCDPFGKVRPRQRPARGGARRGPQRRGAGALRRRHRHRPVGHARRPGRSIRAHRAACRAAPRSATSTGRRICTGWLCRLGVVSKTGVAGLTLGGGVGWLVRKHGLSCDNVSSLRGRYRRRRTAFGERAGKSRPFLGAARWRRQLRHRDLLHLPRTADLARCSVGLSCTRATKPARCCASTATSWPRRRRN